MFGMNLTNSLTFQNFVQNDSQERFEAIVCFEDDAIEMIETYLDNGYIIYDLLNEDQKRWIDINLD